jgi:hypothetical protein
MREAGSEIALRTSTAHWHSGEENFDMALVTALTAHECWLYKWTFFSHETQLVY